MRLYLVGLLILCVTSNRDVFDNLYSDGQSNCPGNVPKCADLSGWVRDMQENGRCLPRDTPKLKCRQGFLPNSYAYMNWKVSHSCADYYQQSYCTLYNEPHLDQETITKKCALPELGIRSCTLLQDKVLQAEQLYDQDRSGRAYEDLAVLLFDFVDHKEWMMLPSHRVAVHAVSKGLELSLVDRSVHDLGPFWHVLLRYCVEAFPRAVVETSPQALPESKVRELSENECKLTTKLDLFAKYHPAWIAAGSNFAEAKTLQKLVDIGLDYVYEEEVWKQLSILAGGDPAASYTAMTKHRTALLLTAGDRGSDELRLALSMDSSLPIGGQRRYDEMVTLSELANQLQAGRSKTFGPSFVNVLAEADALIAAGPIQWVDALRFAELRAQMHGIVQKWKTEDECILRPLQRKCSDADIQKALQKLFPSKNKSAARAGLRSRCLQAGLSADCVEEDLVEKSRSDQKQKAHKTLRDACASKGIPAHVCSEDELAFVLALERRCISAGLASTCSEHDLELYFATTTTTTSAILPQPYCAITERTALNFGITIGFKAHGKCNSITCSPINFLGQERAKFFSAKLEGHKCKCISQGVMETVRLDMSTVSGCSAASCWNQYSHLLLTKLFKGRQHLAEQDPENPLHWEAACRADLPNSTMPPI